MTLNLIVLYKDKSPFKYNDITMFDIEDDRCIASFLDSDDVLVEIELNNNVQGLMTEVND